MFRFTIRDVLWLMVVVALAMAWWVERRQLSRDNAYLRKAIDNSGFVPSAGFNGPYLHRPINR